MPPPQLLKSYEEKNWKIYLKELTTTPTKSSPLTIFYPTQGLKQEFTSKNTKRSTTTDILEVK